MPSVGGWVGHSFADSDFTFFGHHITNAPQTALAFNTTIGTICSFVLVQPQPCHCRLPCNRSMPYMYLPSAKSCQITPCADAAWRLDRRQVERRPSDDNADLCTRPDNLPDYGERLLARSPAFCHHPANVSILDGSWEIFSFPERFSPDFYMGVHIGAALRHCLRPDRCCLQSHPCRLRPDRSDKWEAAQPCQRLHGASSDLLD